LRLLQTFLVAALTNSYYGLWTNGTFHALEEGKPRKASRRKARQQWLSLIPNTHEGYITWEQFERVQLAIGENMRGRFGCTAVAGSVPITCNK
jgi:hypothetical protein